MPVKPLYKYCHDNPAKVVYYYTIWQNSVWPDVSKLFCIVGSEFVARAFCQAHPEYYYKEEMETVECEDIRRE